MPILDDPAPQIVGQVIEVPKIPWIWTMRSFVDFLRQPQTAEQLEEVPTIISVPLLSLLHALLEYKQRTAEQNDGIPVVGGSGAGGGLSGFLLGQSYSFTAEQIVDNPVPRPGGAGGLPGFRHGHSSTAFSEHPGGGRQDFQPVQASQRLLRILLDKLAKGFFALFPVFFLKCEDPAHPGVGTGCRVELMDAVSLALFGGTTWGAASSPCC